MNKKILGRQIRKARRAKDITQASLGNMVGLTESAISMWERGVSTPTLPVYFQLIKILDLPSWEIIHGQLD